MLCVPERWAENPDDLAWERVVIKHDSPISRVHECTKQITSSFSTAFHLGPWHAFASGGYSDRTHELNTSAMVDKLGVSFEIARIDIMRPWFKASLLTYPGTRIVGHRRGDVCSGSLSKAGSCTFPFYPTALVVARNINLYNTFTDEEQAFFEEVKGWSADVSVGYGPFSLSNTTRSQTDLSDEEKKEFGDSVKISLGDELQIIGYVNTVLAPEFPAADDQSLQLGIDFMGMA